jgi:hypothetical protein
MTVTNLVFVEDGGGIVNVPDHARDGIKRRKRPGHLLRRTGPGLAELEHVENVGPSSRSPEEAAAALRHQEQREVRSRAVGASNPISRQINGLA